MMKKIFIPFSIIASIYNYTQVGIGTTSIANSEVLNISSSKIGETGKRGVLFPRVALASETDVTTVSSPATSLIVYNKNVTKRGFYSWTGAKWERSYDKNAILELIVPAVNTMQPSTSGVSQTTGTGGAVGYTVGLNTGELTTDHAWVALPGLSKVLTITSATNTTTITGSGTLQITNTTANATQIHSYSIGIFINNRLFSVRPIILNGRQGMTCMAEGFDIKANVQNLPVGSYTVAVYAITRAQISGGGGIVLNWLQPASGCTNLNAFMTNGMLTLQNQQF